MREAKGGGSELQARFQLTPLWLIKECPPGLQRVGTPGAGMIKRTRADELNNDSS